MLKLAFSMRELDFSGLMNVYSESNRYNGSENWPNEPAGVGILLAEQDFRQYLQEIFFTTAGAVYALWVEKGVYVSALRLEPYQDGLLLEGLETSPQFRRKGYGAALVSETLSKFPGKKIYSHIAKQNQASISLHEQCGFQKILDHAVYVDGSVSSRAYTYLYQS